MSDGIRILYLNAQDGSDQWIRSFLLDDLDGIEIERVATLEQALAAHARDDFQVVVGDADALPGDPLGLVDAMRTNAPQIPIILLSSAGSEALAVEAIKRGVADYLIKSESQLRKLGLTIREVIEKKRLRDEREDAESALRASEKKFRLMAETIQEVFWAYSPGSDSFLYISPAYETIWGRPVADLYADAQLWLSSVHPDERGMVMHHRDLQRSGRATRETFRIRFPDGTWRWIYNRAFPVRDETGGIPFITGVAADITERRLAEDALKANLDFLETFLDALPCPVFFKDREGIYRHCNAAFAERIIGLSKSGIIGKSLDGLLPQESVTLSEMVGAHDDKVLAPNGIRDYEVRIPGPDGEPRNYLVVEAPFYGEDRAPAGLVGTMQDITGRKQAELRLLRSERRFRTMIQNSVDGVVIVDDAGVVRFVNPAAEAIFGKHADTLVGVSFGYPHLIEGPLEQSIARQDGDPVIVDMRGTRIEWGDEPANLLLLRDITEATRARNERKRLENHLRRAQKMEAIGTLAGGISHDFNNILSAIIGYTDLALDAAPKGSEISAHLGQVMKASLRARDLVHQILTFSRETEEEKKPVRLGAIAKETLKLLRSSLPSTIDIQTRITQGDIGVLAVPTQMHQVIMNLCTNAAHAMRAHGGVLGVEISAVTITDADKARFPELSPGPHVCLSVEDTGHGMTPEIMESIFDPYFTTKGKGEGTGLGLSVVHGIVDHHAGAIRVASEPGKGSRFDIYLPALADRPQPTVLTHDELPGGRETILVVDDEPALVDVLKLHLERLGYRVEGCTDSSIALSVFSAAPERFDLVITDLTMPGMTGVDLAQRITVLRPGIPILLCTGYHHSLSEGKWGSAGFCGIITKPILKEVLAAAVRKALDKG